jgi:hypothetical protein
MKASEARLATPCGADWRAMRPQGGTARLCADCNKLVHDLSGMTEPRARALLGRPRNEGLCIRYLHDEQGNIWFRGSALAGIVAPGRLVRRGLAALAGAAALVAVPSLLEACGGASPNDPASAGGTAQLTPAAPTVATPADDASPGDAQREAAPAEPVDAGNAEADDGGGPGAGDR